MYVAFQDQASVCHDFAFRKTAPTTDAWLLEGLFYLTTTLNVPAFFVFTI